MFQLIVISVLNYNTLLNKVMISFRAVVLVLSQVVKTLAGVCQSGSSSGLVHSHSFYSNCL